MRRNRYDAGTSFVDAGPPVRLEPDRPVQLPAPSAHQVVELRTSYRDRSTGWLIATAPLSTVGGLVGVLVAILGWSVPVLSVPALLIFFGGFGLVWLAGWLAHVFVSPDGTAFVEALLGFWLVRQDQKQRHRERRQYERS